MKILFTHLNFPAQFIHLAAYLGKNPAHQVVFLTEREDGEMAGVAKALYKPHRQPAPKVHAFLRELEGAVLAGQAAANAALQLRKEGFIPDLIVGHSGWGSTLFLKDIFPNAKMIGLFEWFYRAYGSDVEFIEKNVSLESQARIRLKNATILEDLTTCDAGYCPTYWQQSQFPNEYMEKLRVIHDGIDTAWCVPRPGASLTLPHLSLDLSGASELITYVGRGLEPYRGFPEFMKAMETVLRKRPQAQVVIVGNQEDVFYGVKRKDGRSHKEAVLELVDIDLKRVHFTGYLPKPLYLQVLQASTVHVYMTVPFVLSWSMLEAMSCECTVVASDTKPVTEVINDGVNGLLAEFNSPAAIADAVITALQSPRLRKGISRRARQTILDRFEVNSMVQKQLQFFQGVLNS